MTATENRLNAIIETLAEVSADADTLSYVLRSTANYLEAEFADKNEVIIDTAWTLRAAASEVEGYAKKLDAATHVKHE